MNNLLLTGTINPSHFNNTNVVITDINRRLSQYETALHYYITESQFNNIIFVENSSYKFNAEKFHELAKQFNKQFEYIPINTNVEKTIQLGKSYGEAECIIKGINNSKLLRNEKSFFKITGRVILKNDKKFSQYKDDLSRFLFRNDLKKCYTVFFKANIEEYKKYFSDAQEKCNESKHKDIETVFYQIISDKKLKIKSFKYYPLLYGTIGTTGESYNDIKIVFLIKNLMARLGMFTYSTNGGFINTLAKIRLTLFKKHISK